MAGTTRRGEITARAQKRSPVTHHNRKRTVSRQNLLQTSISETIAATSGLPTKATINNANGEQACELSQEYVNTPVWESVYTLTCTNNATTTPDTGLNGITAVWLSIHTINATR